MNLVPIFVVLAAPIHLPYPQITPADHFDSSATHELHLAEVEAERDKLQTKLLPYVARGAKVIYVEGIYTPSSVQFWMNMIEARENGTELTSGQRRVLAGWWRLVAIGELELKPWHDGKVEDGAIVLGEYH